MLRGRAGGNDEGRVRARVERARVVQRDRAKRAAKPLRRPMPRFLLAISIEWLPFAEAGSRLLGSAVSRLALSARAYGKVLRVSRTLADLEGCATVAPHHVAEAIGYRALDRSVPLSASSAA